MQRRLLLLTICLTVFRSLPAAAAFEPWIEDLNRCSAMIDDPDLKKAALTSAQSCPAPVVPTAPIQTLNVEQLQKQLQKIDLKSDRPAPKIKTFAEIEAEFAKKKSRLAEGVSFQNQFLEKLESATTAVEKEFKSNPISDPSQHERITQELSQLMEDVNRFCESKRADGNSTKINGEIQRVFSRPEYVYLLANSSFASQVLNLPMGVGKNGKRYKQNSYQVCLNGEPPFRGHLRYRTKYLFNKEAITNAAKQIETDIEKNREKIRQERQTLKTCQLAPKKSAPMEKIDDCMDQVELLLANDLTTYPNAYLSILKDQQQGSALVCLGLMRSETEKIAKENLSNLFMAAGIVSIPLSIAIPGSGIALATIAGALTFSESAVGVSQIIANNRKMEELDASLRAKTINQDQVDKSKSELQEENTGQVIGLVTSVAGAAGDVVGFVKKTNQTRKLAKTSAEIGEAVPAVKPPVVPEAAPPPAVNAPPQKITQAKPQPQPQSVSNKFKTLAHHESEFNNFKNSVTASTQRSRKAFDQSLSELIAEPYPVSEATIATYLQKLDRSIFDESEKLTKDLGTKLNEIRKRIRHPQTPSEEIEGLKKLEQQYLELESAAKQSKMDLVKKKVESMEIIGQKLSSEFTLASELPRENVHLGDHICPDPCDIDHITQHLQKTKRATGGQTTFFPPQLRGEEIWKMIKNNLSVESKPSWQTTLILEKSTNSSIKYWTKSRIVQVVDQVKNVNMKVRVFICAKAQGCIDEAKGIRAKLGEPVTFYPECGESLQIWKNGQLTTGVPCAH